MPPPLGAPATVHFQSTLPGVTFHRDDGSIIVLSVHGRAGHATSYATLCTSPCRPSLPAGTEHLALSVPGKDPISAGLVTIPPGESTVQASYVSHDETRRAGGVVLALGAVAGVALLVAAGQPSRCDQSGCPGPNAAEIGAGSALIFGGGAVGFGLLMVSDTATVRIFPGTRAPPPAPQEPQPLPHEPLLRLNVPGLGVHGSF